MATIEEEGSVLLAVPEVVIQDFTSPCDPAADDNGVFGVWYDVSAEGGNRFDIFPDDTLDVDPRFYDADCEYVGDGGAPLGFLGAQEYGNVPADAEYILVWGYAGSGSFTISI